MNNLKLTLATTLSALALTFSGVASAGERNNENFYTSGKVIKSTSTLIRAQPIKRPSQYKPTRRVVTSKRVYKKRGKVRFVSNKRFHKMNKFEQRVNYKKYIKRHNRFKSNRAATKHVYRVRPGDTLIQISFKTGVSVFEIARLNRIKYRDLNYLRIGQKLKLA